MVGDKEKISGFTTSFNTGDVNRSSNIKAAADTINGTILWPGEVFSMNRGLGDRTEEKGYKTAYVIVNGLLVDGLAGGICQATTAVYNAVLLTISGNDLDLKFKNTTSAPIYKPQTGKLRVGTGQ